MKEKIKVLNLVFLCCFTVLVSISISKGMINVYERFIKNNKQIIYDKIFNHGKKSEKAVSKDTISYDVLISDYDKPKLKDYPYINATNGDIGFINAQDAEFAWDGNSACTVTITDNNKNDFAGMWHSLGRCSRNNTALDFKAIFGPYVLAKYQGQVSEVEIKVNKVDSPTNNKALKLRLELRDLKDKLVAKKEFNEIKAGTYEWVLPDECKKKVKLVSWILDDAKIQDSITVDSLKLKTQVPCLEEMPSGEQAFLWSYSWLMANYNAETGMVQDRSDFADGEFENVTATAKAAKITYYACRKGYVSLEDAKNIITKTADTLIHKVPRGPEGINKLWPHFTQNGGTQIIPKTEWASGDSVIAAMDEIAALEVIGDPKKQVKDFEKFLKEINWNGLLTQTNYLCHGYHYDGEKFPNNWQGFGMETMSVNLAYAASTGKAANMDSPPSDDGCGFIDNAQYPLVFSGIDRYGNDWDEYRNAMADRQIQWYQNKERNWYLYDRGLFGFSAAEMPEADGRYGIYGTGGKYYPAIDCNEVVVGHYAGMIADLHPNEAIKMWEAMRDSKPDFLKNKIAISPLNNVESMRVDKKTGKCMINYLKGSWNLALHAEGWAMADEKVRKNLVTVIKRNKFLNGGWEIMKKQDSTIAKE